MLTCAHTPQAAEVLLMQVSGFSTQVLSAAWLCFAVLFDACVCMEGVSKRHG